MNVPKVNLDAIMRNMQAQLSSLSQKLTTKENIPPAEVRAAVNALSAAADQLEEGSFDKKAIKQHFTILNMVKAIQDSPSLMLALGVYQTQLSGIFLRIEKVIRENEGTAPVKKVEFDRLDR